MNRTFNSCMKNWVKMINESTYSFNPDDDKTDQNFIDADNYEKLAKDIKDYYKEVEKTGKIEGNLKESDETPSETDDSKSNDESKPDNQDVQKEGLSTDDILNRFDKKNKELAAIQAQIANKVSEVDIIDLYDGYIGCDVTFKNGDKKFFEFDITEDELKDMLNQLHEKVKKEYADDLTIEDAAVAVIRKRLDPTDTLDWFYKPTNTSLDQWILDQEIEREDLLTNYDKASAGWARQMGLFANDEGEFDDDNFKDWDDGSTDSYFKQ